MGTKADGMGQAMSYLAQTGGVEYDGLALPLFQRGAGAASPFGDTSGINLFNASSTTAATIEVTFYDQSGATVAPTLSSPVVTTIPAFGGLTIYAPTDLSTLPLGFQGSVVIKIDSGGPVSGVSNDVNYAVQGDGSAVFNLAVVPGLFTPPPAPTPTPSPTTPPPVLACTQATAVNTPTDGSFVDETHSVTCTLTQGGQPLNGYPVTLTVTSGPNADATVTGVTQAPNGTVTLQYTYANQGNESGIDTIHICATVGDQSVCQDPDLTKDWQPTVTLTLTKTQVSVAGVGDATSDVTASGSVTPSGATANLVIVNGTATASFAPCGNPVSTSTSITGSYSKNIFVCNGVAGQSFQVEVQDAATGQVIAGPITVTVGP
jgi:hypothetical protein